MARHIGWVIFTLLRYRVGVSGLGEAEIRWIFGGTKRLGGMRRAGGWKVIEEGVGLSG